MNVPWKENATLVRTAAAGQSDDQSCEILFEGPLMDVAKKVLLVRHRPRCHRHLLALINES